jgi:hypothetical protein
VSEEEKEGNGERREAIWNYFEMEKLFSGEKEKKTSLTSLVC